MINQLASLLETWREHRQPEIADLAEAVITALLVRHPRPTIGATKKSADRTLWREVAAQRDPLDFPRLIASARGGAQVDVKLQVQFLSSWDHPGMGRGLLALLEDPPYAGIKSRPMLEEIFEALELTRDVRLVKPARTLAKRYLSIVNSSTGGWIVSELERITKALEAFSPAQLSAEQRALVEDTLQSLPAEFRPQEQAPESSAQDLEALLLDIYAHPDDDEKRLVFARALQNEDHARAEFITLQIGAARGTNPPEQSARLKELTTHARLAGWAQPLSMSGECEFARGFPVAIRLYKTASSSLGEKAWATIERVEALNALTQKAALEFLDNPSLANVKSVSSISSKVLAALQNRVRVWTALTLTDDTMLDTQLLQRVPELRELKLNLRGGKTAYNARLLWDLPHLQRLELSIGNTPKGTLPQVPPTVTKVVVDGDGTPGLFAFAPAVEELRFRTSKVEKAHLEGLVGLKSLDVRAYQFEADIFEATPALQALTITLAKNEAILPRRMFYPVKGLKGLDLMYTRLGPDELAPLVELEELRNHWHNIDTVPALPRMTRFHCMLPRTVAEIERFLERNPQVRELDFCWNSGSELWFSGDPGPLCNRAWEQFFEVLSRSGVVSWGNEDKVRVTRGEHGWSIAAKEHLYTYEWGLPGLVLKTRATFGIPPKTTTPWVSARPQMWLSPA